jgi:hypothetical protein
MGRAIYDGGDLSRSFRSATPTAWQLGARMEKQDGWPPGAPGGSKHQLMSEGKEKQRWQQDDR